MHITRRDFLNSAFLAGGTLLIGGWHAIPTLAEIAGGTKLGDLAFDHENSVRLEQLLWSGLDGRLFTNLSKLDEDSLITPTDKFYIRTCLPDRIDLQKPWSITVSGLVGSNYVLTMPDLESAEQDVGVHLMECSGNVSRQMDFGMLSACRWTGVPMSKILNQVKVPDSATQILISGFDDHSQPSVRSLAGASWIFPLQEFRKSKAFLALKMNDKPLTPNHGYPVRFIMPGWYGCTCIKWVNEISFVDDTAPSTTQMREFAGRTHQIGVPSMARDFSPAKIDQAAMVVRVEKWLVDGHIRYRLIGILWGGDRPIKHLSIRFRPDDQYFPVDTFDQQTNETWSLWSYMWQPTMPGRYGIQLKVMDPGVVTKRLDKGYYTRWVDITDIG